MSVVDDRSRRLFSNVLVLLAGRENDFIDEKDGTGYSALHFAVQGGSQAMVQLLLDKGADVNLHANDDAYTKTLHSHASSLGWHLPSQPEGETSLHLAVRCGNPNIVQLLLDKGAHLEVKTMHDYTPLHRAVSCQLEVVQILLDKGADINARTRAGWTPEDLAFLNGHAEVLKSPPPTLHPQS